MSKESYLDKKLSRRQFVGTAAASAAMFGVVAGASPLISRVPSTNQPATSSSGTHVSAPNIAGPVGVPSSWDQVADVIVVGFGGAGGAAALSAAAAGAQVLLLEKMTAPGGCSAMAAGAFAACGTQLQQIKGIVDSPGKMFDFYTKAGMGVTDPDVLTAFCTNSAMGFQWLTNLFIKQTGVTDITKLWGSLNFSGSSYVIPADVVPRWTLFSGNAAAGLPSGGAGEFKAVYNAVQANPNVQVMLSTPAVALVTDGSGNVVGVQAFSNNDLKFFKANRGVVITTGDYSRDDEMAKQYNPFLYYGFKITALGCTGDGIKLGQQVGADLSGMGGEMSHPRTIEVPPGAVQNSVGGSWGTNGVPGAANGELSTSSIIFVDNKGQRFVNESTMSIPNSALAAAYVPGTWTSYYAGFQIFSQDQMQAWAIFDNAVASKGGNTVVSYFSKDLSTELANGSVVQANTIPALATALGMNPTALTNTINQWNGDAANNVDTLYSRPNSFMQITTPPFYAMPLNWTCDQSFGGLRTNGKTQVLDAQGYPIPHLFAAGSTCGGINGRFYQTSGLSVGSVYTMGLLAGAGAAAESPV